MNPSYDPSSRSTRIAGVIAAGACTVLMLGLIDAMADHYGAESPMARARPIVVALR